MALDLEITPEPDDAERAAIAAALAIARQEATDATDAWWEAGVRERPEPEGEPG